MRWALAILISLNAVLFLWIQFGPAHQGREAASRKVLPDFGDIRLLEETAPAEAAETGEAEALPAAAATARARYCGELGPFPSRNMAEGFRRKLARDPEARVGIESRKGKVDIGYWVMIPPLANAKEAQAMLKKLRRAGFKDLWLMRKGEHANSISLGLYTEERYARRHGNDIRKKGFEAVIVPKQRKGRLFWVVFSGLGQDALEALEKDRLPRRATLQKKTCARGSAEN